MARSIRYLRLKFIFLFSVMILFGIGCMFRDLKKEVAEYEQLYALSGKVTQSSHKGQVIVILYTVKDNRKGIVEYTLTQDKDQFSFMVPEGSYYLAAFEDQNSNLAYDKPEPAGYFGSPGLIVVSPDQLKAEGTKGIKDLNIQLSPESDISTDFPTSLDGVTFIPRSFVKLGTIADLDDAVFDSENGDTGYWKPLSFLRNCGIGVYFVEPYDPHKIPILFVHGATGTPRPWSEIVEQLDRDKYQPWFFYYPSGLRLDRLGFILNNIVKALHHDYGFNTLYVTAHSMGGLVSRSFILNSYNDKQDYIKLFVSISTPWNGHSATAKGVKQAPAVVPSWYDMVPDSEFIQSLFTKKLPPFTKYYLFFSFKGDCSMMMANNDGSVELTSELDYRAQADAVRIFGYDEDHTAILASKNVINQYNLILESMSEQPKGKQ